VHDGLGLAGQLESRETIQQLAEEQRGHQPDELARYTHVRPEAEGEMLLVLVPPNAEALRVRETAGSKAMAKPASSDRVVSLPTLRT
jgi:hypothetical protein